MLLDGEIDLMSDISYTDERAKNMLFTTLPMGSESYYMCVSAKRDSGIDAGDYSTVNGKRVGVNKGSFQEKLFREWMEKNDVRARVVELTVGETEAIEMLDQGLIDVLVDIDAYGIIKETIPVCFVGSSDYYFVVNKSRPDLLKQLNAAMQRVQDEDRYFNQHLQEKYFSSSFVSLYLSQDEVEWLSSHGPVRVGYRDDYLAFCGQDKESGELIGALKDYLDISAGFLQNAQIEFETVPFTTMEESLQALKDGTIDCIFPVCLTDYDGEELGIMMTEPLMHTEMYVAMRSSERAKISLQSELSVALVEGEPNYRTFLMEKFPDWKIIYYKSPKECFESVAAGMSDCLLLSNYRPGRNADLLEKYRLTTITTGEDMSFSFALRRQDDHLYAILSREANFIPDTLIDSALAAWSFEEKRYTLMDYFRDHFLEVIILFAVILLVILFLLIRSQHSEKRARESLQALKESQEREKQQQRELSDTRRMAYKDPLTGVKSKRAFAEMQEDMDGKISREGREFPHRISTRRQPDV